MAPTIAESDFEAMEDHLEATTDNQHIQPIVPPTIQQSILATFRHRQPIATALPTETDNQPIQVTQQPANDHPTVGEYIRMLNRNPSEATQSDTDTDATRNPPPVIATRASSRYKHSKWRPAALVREKFSQYFRK